MGAATRRLDVNADSEVLASEMTGSLGDQNPSVVMSMMKAWNRMSVSCYVQLFRAIRVVGLNDS